MMDIDCLLAGIKEEARRSMAEYGPYKSTHEALGVIEEEIDELKDAIRANDCEQIATEARQVSAVALKLLLDLEIPALRTRSGFDK